MLWIFFFRNNNPCSDIRLRLKKSAEVILLKATSWTVNNIPQKSHNEEGLNVKSL